MSSYAQFTPNDPEAVRFIQWLIGVANVQVTDFDATLDREIQDISSGFGMYSEFRPVGNTEITVHLTLRGHLPPGASYAYSTEPSVQDKLPPMTKALP